MAERADLAAAVRAGGLADVPAAGFNPPLDVDIAEYELDVAGFFELPSPSSPRPP
jgi:hypothetical protein